MRHLWLSLLTFSAAGAALADTASSRWTGPYAGLSFGAAAGEARGAGGTATTRFCNVEGTRYDMAPATAFAPGSFITSIPALPGSPPGATNHTNVGDALDADALGLVPVGTPFAFRLRAETGGGLSEDADVQVQALGYGGGPVRALVDGRDQIFDPGTLTNIDNPFDCLILNEVTAHLRAIGPYPDGTVGLRFEDGTTVIAWSDDPEPETGGVFEDVAAPTPGASTDISGQLAGALAGYAWDLGNGFLAGVEGRAWFGAVEGGAVSVDGLITVGGRGGVVVGQTLVFATLGAAFAEVEVGGARDRASGFAVGLGSEFALTDRLSARADYTWIDLAETDQGADVDFGIAGVALVMRF